MKLKNVLKEISLRTQQVSNLQKSHVKLDPDVQNVSDEVVGDLYNRWYEAGSPKSVTIKYKADHSALKVREFKIV